RAALPAGALRDGWAPVIPGGEPLSPRWTGVRRRDGPRALAAFALATELYDETDPDVASLRRARKTITPSVRGDDAPGALVAESRSARSSPAVPDLTAD